MMMMMMMMRGVLLVRGARSWTSARRAPGQHRRVHATVPRGAPWVAWRPIFWKFLDFSKNRFFGLFNRPGGPGAFKIVFMIKKYPGGLIYSFRS